MSKEKNEVTAKKTNTSLTSKLIDFFGGVKEFNTGMAIISPSIINVLQAQSENELGLSGTFQLGTGALLLTGNSLFYRKGDPSMHSRMGIFTGAIKTVTGVSIIGLGLAKTMQLDKSLGMPSSIAYLGYCVKTLLTVIDLFNAAAYGKQAVNDSQKLAAHVKV